MKLFTVAQLIEHLRTFPQDAYIAYTFETVVCHISPDDLYLSKDGVVMIGDDYRDEFESGTWPAMPSVGND